MGIVDANSNNVTLVEVIEEISYGLPQQVPPGMPHGMPLMSVDVVSFWIREQADLPVIGQGRITIVGPNAVRRSELEFDIDLLEKPRCRTVLRILGTVFPGAGQHFIEVECRQNQDEQWARAAQIPITVIQVGAAANGPN
jgi:hypothetical protein